MFENPCSEQRNLSKQKIYKVTMEKSIVIIVIMRYIHTDHDLFEIVSCELQRFQLRVLFLFCIHLPRRLYIDATIPIIYHKVDLTGYFLVAGSLRYLTDTVQGKPESVHVPATQIWHVSESLQGDAECLLPA